MADESKPTIHVDIDWKKQAQEEKKRLAEQAAAKAAAPVTSPSAAPAGPGATAPGKGGGARAMPGENPPATFATLVQSILTQILFYLGDLAPRGSQPQINLDAAKHNIDLLTLLEEKTVNNLTEEEKRLLDAALYETRMRYVGVASQYT
jgi:Domain of unknown function (DUF1844)